jgi:inorganic phosphate transporter, PiT family
MPEGPADMSLALVILVLVVAAALVFDYINGFHDAANAVATVVSTGVLPLRTAILLAAILNFLGALTGTAVAATIGTGLIQPHAVTQVVVLSALIGAIAWNLITWYFGIPSSSSHALVGGLVGSAMAHAGGRSIHVPGLVKVVESLVVSPLVGFALGFVFMIALFWICRHRSPQRLNRTFRRLQIASAGFMALSHGSNDAQKTMGIIAMSLAVYHGGSHAAEHFEVPTWVMAACAIAMGAGTMSGGVRIIKTMGTKIIDLKPIHGFVAETSAAATILAASHLGLPVSTTHVISGAIMGVGSSQRVSAVRWGVTARIAWAWVLTIPISAAIAWIGYHPLELALGVPR